MSPVRRRHKLALVAMELVAHKLQLIRLSAFRLQRTRRFGVINFEWFAHCRELLAAGRGAAAKLARHWVEFTPALRAGASNSTPCEPALPTSVHIAFCRQRGMALWH